jgi:hypothetical protein
LTSTPLRRLVLERARHLVSDLAAPVDVGHEVQRVLGGGDRLQEGREDLVAVDEELDLVARRHRRTGQDLGGAHELRRPDVQVGAPAEVIAVARLAPVTQ